MPTIIDSLFLELGIDVSKFSKDQAVALSKIQQFEAQTKRAGKVSSEGIQTVGRAFRGLAPSIDAGAARIENLSDKIKDLGHSLGASGGIAAPLGAVTRGIGALLSPTALWGAAIGAAGYAMWDLNEVMTANNAAMTRQAQLSGMSASNMWSWAEAAKTVGANPMEIAGGISGLQTAITGMGIGAGSAMPQLIALARLGVPYNFQSGADIGALMTRVNTLAAARGFENLGSLRALTSPVMNDAMFDLATNRNTTPAEIEKWINDRKPGNIQDTLTNSLKSQEILGKLGISKDVLSETAYGGTQGLMQAVVQILTKLLDLTDKMLGFIGDIANDVKTAVSWFTGGVGKRSSISGSVSGRQSQAMKFLMSRGMAPDDAAAIVGNLTQESTMNPFATNELGYKGLMQLDPSRQKKFASFAGYSIGDLGVSFDKQFWDELAFMMTESQFVKARQMMSSAQDLSGKTDAFKRFYEVVYDTSLAKRLAAANDTLAASGYSSMVQSTVNNNIRTGDIHTNATNGKDFATDFKKELSTHPLLGPFDVQTLTLATRGAQ